MPIWSLEERIVEAFAPPIHRLDAHGVQASARAQATTKTLQTLPLGRARVRDCYISQDLTEDVSLCIVSQILW